MSGVVVSFWGGRSGGHGEQQPLKGDTANAAPAPPPPKQARRPGRFGKRSWADVEQSQRDANAQIDGWMRAAFIRKVYAILSTQLLATVGMVVGMLYLAFVSGDPTHPTSWGWWIAGPGYFLTFVVAIVALFLLCALMACKNSHPLNLVGLGAFTIAEAFTIGTLSIVYYGSGLGDKLLLAFILTTATFLILTAVTIFTKIDFSFLAPLLCVGMLVFMFWGLIMSLAFAIGGFSRDWQLVWVIVGVILFTGFILYDTYMIITHLGVDDYIIAAIELYLDVINMFLLILQMLTLCGGRN